MAATSRSSFWLIGVAALLVVGAGVLGWRLAGVANGEAQESTVPRPPNVRLAALGGGTVGFGDFEGEIVVVDFWASWCGPCRLQAKILAPLHEQLDGRVQFLAINLGEDLATVERYVAKNAFPYPVLMDPAGDPGRRPRYLRPADGDDPRPGRPHRLSAPGHLRPPDADRRTEGGGRCRSSSPWLKSGWPRGLPHERST